MTQPIITIEQAVAVLNEKKWRGRDDWLTKWFAGGTYAYLPDTWERDYLPAIEAIAIANSLVMGAIITAQEQRIKELEVKLAAYEQRNSNVIEELRGKVPAWIQQAAREIADQEWGELSWSQDFDFLVKILTRRYAEAALENSKPGEGTWQPIETAPRNGMPLLLCWPQWDTLPTIGSYSKDRERWALNDQEFYDKSQPTHWMPLPEPPAD